MFLIEPERGCSRGCNYCVMRRTTNGGMRTVAARAGALARASGGASGSASSAPRSPITPGSSSSSRRSSTAGREVGVSSLRADRLDASRSWTRSGPGARSAHRRRRRRLAADARPRRPQALRGADPPRGPSSPRAAGMERLKVYNDASGCPLETDEDIDELVRFSTELSKILPIALGVAPFVAKRNTPLDGAPFAGIPEVEARLERLREGASRAGRGPADVGALGVGRVRARPGGPGGGPGGDGRVARGRVVLRLPQGVRRARGRAVPGPPGRGRAAKSDRLADRREEPACRADRRQFEAASPREVGYRGTPIGAAWARTRNRHGRSRRQALAGAGTLEVLERGDPRHPRALRGDGERGRVPPALRDEVPARDRHRLARHLEGDRAVRPLPVPGGRRALAADAAEQARSGHRRRGARGAPLGAQRDARRHRRCAGREAVRADEGAQGPDAARRTACSTPSSRRRSSPTSPSRCSSCSTARRRSSPRPATSRTRTSSSTGRSSSSPFAGAPRRRCCARRRARRTRRSPTSSRSRTTAARGDEDRLLAVDALIHLQAFEPARAPAEALLERGEKSEDLHVALAAGGRLAHLLEVAGDRAALAKLEPRMEKLAAEHDRLHPHHH